MHDNAVLAYDAASAGTENGHTYNAGAIYAYVEHAMANVLLTVKDSRHCID